MMTLLWLIVTALGLQLVFEVIYEVKRLTGLRIRTFALYATALWLAVLAYTAIWWVAK
jgi:hypothetical protein